MTKIVWGQVGERRYEAGLDRGVLYFPEGGGVPWNGLTSLEESSGSSVTPVFFDGVKSNDIVTGGNFSATLSAITYPEEFQRFIGVLEDQTGLFIADQLQAPFNLSYRTKIGDDINGLDHGYKIHLLYNLTAVPSQVSRTTLADNATPIEFQWDLTAVPEELEGYRPTAHVIIDSREIDEWLLQDIEDILYGDETREPSIPPLKGFTTFIRNWNRLIIVDNGDGTWTATTSFEGYIQMLDETMFQITEETAVYLDAVTYQISSTEKNEDEIWQP